MESDVEVEVDRPNSRWCLVGNIVDERPYGPGGAETRAGTKHFSGGTKVYCLPARWGDGYEQIIVVGRHRGSKQFATMTISRVWVENWRAQVVYSPTVLRCLVEAGIDRKFWSNWSEQEAKASAAALNDRDAARKAQCRTQ